MCKEPAVVRGCAGGNARGKYKKEQISSECSPEYSLNILRFVAPALPMLEAVCLKLIALDGFFFSFREFVTWGDNNQINEEIA